MLSVRGVVAALIAGILTCGIMVASTQIGYAQPYPYKPIRIITGSVGGGNDTVSRMISQGISGPFGQPVIVENRGSRVYSADAVYRAPPDGYTLLMAANSLWISALMQKTSYDAVDGFTPISLISRDVFIVVVHPSVPVKSVQELIAYAKARPGQLNYGSGSVGSSPHLAGELMKSMTGIDMVRIPYAGNAPVITSILANEVQMTIIDLGLVAPHMKSGKLRALAVTTATPSALTPDLPTVAASGVPGYEVVGMTVMLAPAKTPNAVVTKVNREVVRVLNLPDVKERLLNAGSEVVASSPEQFAAVMKADIAKWGKVVKDAGIRVD